MRINKKRMLDEKSFRLRYLEKKPVKDNLDDFGLNLKQKLNDLQRASNRRFDYTTQKLISEIIRKIDGNMSTKAIKDVIEKTENVINKIPDYNDKMADIKDEIHNLLDDCKLTLNKNNTTTIPDTASVLPRYVFTKNNTKEVKDETTIATLEEFDWEDLLEEYIKENNLSKYRDDIFYYYRFDEIKNLEKFMNRKDLKIEFEDIEKLYTDGEIELDKSWIEKNRKYTNDSKKMRDEFISHDADYRVGDWTDVLRIYLEWNGIIGYDSIIEDYLKNKDFDGLRKYFEEEGIYGYADDIIDIYENGEINIPDMSREDYDAFFK